MVHHLQKILKLASVLDRELSLVVHVKEVVIDLTLVAQAEGKAVHLCPLSDKEEPVSEAIAPHSTLTLFSVDGSMEPLLLLVEDASQELLKGTPSL